MDGGCRKGWRDPRFSCRGSGSGSMAPAPSCGTGGKPCAPPPAAPEGEGGRAAAAPAGPGAGRGRRRAWGYGRAPARCPGAELPGTPPGGGGCPGTSQQSHRLRSAGRALPPAQGAQQPRCAAPVRSPRRFAPLPRGAAKGRWLCWAGSVHRAGGPSGGQGRCPPGCLPAQPARAKPPLLSPGRARCLQALPQKLCPGCKAKRSPTWG